MPESIATGTSQLLCVVASHVATVTLNRPQKKNALSDELTPALRAVLPLLEQREDVRCIVITGAGEAFCAGGDVSQMGAGISGGSEQAFETRLSDLQQKQRTLTQRLFELKTPTIAALPGAAAGAGLCIALACDLRVACQSAFVTTAYANIGLSGDYGGSWLMHRLLGPAKTKDLYFTARRVDAAECLRIGLVDRVFADDQFHDSVQTLAHEISTQTPLALRYMKEHINQADSLSLTALLDLEAEHLLRCAATEDHGEAVNAFMQKRPAKFTGQ